MVPSFVKDYEVCYTVGMRGVHDYGFSTKNIDEDAALTEEEKLSAKIKLLETIMEDQRQIIQTECGLSSPFAYAFLSSFVVWARGIVLKKR